ncbi:MAG: transporter [Phycisphaerales bacterium]
MLHRPTTTAALALASAIAHAHAAEPSTPAHPDPLRAPPLALSANSSANAPAESPLPAWIDEFRHNPPRPAPDTTLALLRRQPNPNTAPNTPANTPPDALPDIPTNASAAPDHGDLAKKLQNPVADLISIPLQFNYDNGFGPKDADRYTLNIQPVISISLNDDWNLISRTIVPIIYQESLATGLDSDFGIGDTLQSLFFSPKEPVGGWILGAGPAALIPTGTTPSLRSEQLALGLTGVALQQRSGWTYGALANHLWGVTDTDHDEVNATFIQPFLSYTFPTATSLTANAEMTYDWTDEELTLPINFLVGQLTTIGKQPIQFQVGGRYYADAPPGGPEWGLRFAITFLFPK